MMTVNEVSKLSGISVRTLHYYDQIGLLHPDQVSEAGYRLYGQASLERLQQILLFRQLEFPLKEIKDIIDSPDFNKEEALDQQIQMLRLQQEHLSGLINLALEIKKNGVNKMDFKPFDTSKLDEYAKEAKERWGDSAAYQESARKTKNYTKEDWNMANEQITSVFAEFGKLKELPPESPDAQMAVKKLQDLISQFYYACDKEVLAGLGQMYTADQRFKDNIDKMGGNGTAEFAARAIACYCK
ncbi:MerR family transcriptional regulator [Emergencia timonensis]|uniref:MerR family transcriptional regulator n=1 Tax=Emergencia timonensis TaxID=1776384 RepID=UPI00082AC52F|nr:MerR family transcriptional regulator [Emergencia timonensis]WNX87228.1 MerR family transcriptional regulator [Emergencia timonensis]